MSEPASREAWRTIQQLMFWGEGQDRIQAVCRSNGIPPSMIRTLVHLSPDEPRAMRDLADNWGCDASYVTALIDGLEERGFAERRPHPTDRRVKTVVLTTAGADTKSRVLSSLWEPPPAFDALSADEQVQLRDLLRKVAAADTVLGAAGEEGGRAGPPQGPRGRP